MSLHDALCYLGLALASIGIARVSYHFFAG